LGEENTFRDGKENLEFTIVMYYPDNGQRSYQPQIKHADRMILTSSHKNSCKCTLEHVEVEKQIAGKVRFVTFFFLFFHTNS